MPFRSTQTRSRAQITRSLRLLSKDTRDLETGALDPRRVATGTVDLTATGQKTLFSPEATKSYIVECVNLYTTDSPNISTPAVAALLSGSTQITQAETLYGFPQTTGVYSIIPAGGAQMVTSSSALVLNVTTALSIAATATISYEVIAHQI